MDPSASTRVQLHPRDSKTHKDKILKSLILVFNFFTQPYTTPPKIVEKMGYSTEMKNWNWNNGTSL